MRQVGISVAAACVLVIPGPAEPTLRSSPGLPLNPMHSAAVERALDGAVRRLTRDAECGRIFADFRDTSGVPLQARLETLGLDGASYLSHIVFVDGFGRRSCHGTDNLAVTAPGSRVVYVCGARFWAAAARNPRRAELIVLHEALHTLGLGENPPDTLEITRRIGERCAS